MPRSAVGASNGTAAPTSGLATAGGFLARMFFMEL